MDKVKAIQDFISHKLEEVEKTYVNRKKWEEMSDKEKDDLMISEAQIDLLGEVHDFIMSII